MTKSVPNSHLALQELRRRIFEGDLPAGSDHLESELADQLGMSRTPVREAVLMLESQGLLALRPRKGVRILPVSPEDMSEIYDVLTELESLAAGRAAEAGYTQDALRDLAQAIDRMDAALERSDLEIWATADDHFHAELVRIGGNRRVMMIAAMMTDQVRRARNTTLYMRPRPTKSNSDHRRVLDAILRGDAHMARSLHRAHREEAKAIIIDLLHKHRLRFL
ncbi:MAG: GntR family transcriptional regulator [Pseudomonadota bacterium]